MEKQKIILRDNTKYEVDKNIVELCEIYNTMVEDFPTKIETVDFDVSRKTFEYITEYCREYLNILTKLEFKDNKVKDLKIINKILDENTKFSNFKKEWLQRIYNETKNHEFLFEILYDSNYLHCNIVLDFVCQTVADQMKNKTPDEIIEFYNLDNKTFSLAEKDLLRKHNKWED